MNALHRAILAGRPAEVLYLLEKRNYDPNARDRNLRTPLIICSLAEKEDSAEVSAALLLRKGAQISLSDRQGKDALCWACQNSRAKLVQMFLEDYPSQFKFHLRKKDRDGNTALHLAARTGNPDTVSLLLQTYTDNNLLAEVSERNARGETPLHLAAKQGNSAAVLALLPLSSDALFRRRGGVDFRSAPKWASAAVKIGRSTGERGVKHGRPFSEQPVAGSAKANAPAARKRRSQTATVSSNLTENPHNGHTGTLNGSKPGGNVSILPRRTNISDIFKISEVQLSANSAYRRPARAPPLPQPPSVCEDDKIHCRRSSTLKLPGKGRRGSFQTSRSRSSTRRTSMTDGDAVDKQNTKPCKAVPTVVVDEPGKEAKVVPTVIIGEAGNGGTVPRPLLSMEYKDKVKHGKPLKQLPSFNQSTLDFTESPTLPGGTHLTPFDQPGMPFDRLSSAASLQSLVSDLPGLSGHGLAFDRSETDPVIKLDGGRPWQIRRTKSEPSLNTLDQTTESLVPRKGNRSRFDNKRFRGPAVRKRGHVKTRVADKDKQSSAASVKRHTKPTPLKIETLNHVHNMAHFSPYIPAASPAPSTRSTRRFFRSGREAESVVQRRRTDLDKRIKSLQREIDLLESRRRGRKYRSLIPDWMTVDEETSLDELVAAVFHDKSSTQDAEPGTSTRNQDNPRTTSSGGTKVETFAGTNKPSRRYKSTSTGSSHEFDSERGRRRSCTSNLDMDIQDVERGQRLPTWKSPRLLQNGLRGRTLRIPWPAQAPFYKQSRSVFASPPEGQVLLRQENEGHNLLHNGQNRSSQSRAPLASHEGSNLRFKPIKPGQASVDSNTKN